jgi:hypothetical protein
MKTKIRATSFVMAALGLSVLGVSAAQPASADQTDDITKMCSNSVFECSFEGTYPSYYSSTVHVGEELANCSYGAAGTITRTVGEWHAKTKEWKVGGKVGGSYKDVSGQSGGEVGLEVGGGGSTTDATRVDMALTAAPGRKTAATVVTLWERRTGSIWVYNKISKENTLFENVSVDKPLQDTVGGADDVACGLEYQYGEIPVPVDEMVKRLFEGVHG